MQHRSLVGFSLVILSLFGCGGGDPRIQAVSKVAASQECIGCHGDAVSQATGLAITEQWLASAHAKRNGAGCADCHEPAAGHPNQCSACHGGGGAPTGYEVARDPDAAGKCAKCHGLSHPDDVQIVKAPQHFGNMTATTSTGRSRASYVSLQYQGKCRACHNPHQNELTREHRDWASSAHGDPNGVAWSARDFKASAACIRCHTSTGFKQYVADFTLPASGFGAGDYTREVLACDACHTSYDFKKSVRAVAAFSAPYNGGQSPASFPDVAESNLCIPCHAGRESGDSILAIPDGTLGNVSFKNSHYLAAAGLMYMKAGFTSFTSPTAAFGTSTYGKSLSPDAASVPGGVTGGTSSTHRKLGTPLINGDGHNRTFFVPGVLDKNGPCVTCHLNATGTPLRPGAGHTLQIDANAYRQVCVNCHTSENTVPLAADGSNFRAVFLEPQAEAFQAALRLAAAVLKNRYNIEYDSGASPYFFRGGMAHVSANAVKDWTLGTGNQTFARKLMGACFNLQILTKEPAAYAHARSYTRRLIYDSIDFLDDGVMNQSVGATAVTSGLTGADGATPLFVRDAKAYNSTGSAITTIYGNSSEAMLFLIGWSRSTGGWNDVERP